MGQARSANERRLPTKPVSPNLRLSALEGPRTACAASRVARIMRVLTLGDVEFQWSVNKEICEGELF